MRVVTPERGWCQTVPTEGNPRLILRLDPLIRSGLEAQAMSNGVSLNELAKFVLVEYVKQSVEAREGTPALLRHLDTLVRTLQLQATALTLPAAEATGPTKQPMKASKDTQQRRLYLPNLTYSTRKIDFRGFESFLLESLHCCSFTTHTFLTTNNDCSIHSVASLGSQYAKLTSPVMGSTPPP
jgi:hypothetical protein